MLKTFLFLIGFGFMTIGLTYIIIYLNLFSIGYTFKEYLGFIIKRFECIIFIIGLLIDSLIIFLKGDKNDLYI